MTYVSEKGFTLIEIIMSLAIMGVLALLVLPMAEISVQHSKERDLRVALREIRDALDAYKKAVDEGRVARTTGSSGYPESLAVLVEGVNDLKNPISNSKMYFLRRIPRDPMNLDASKADSDTWGKRSYESSADDPHEGKDVYDVYSLSPDSGLNGMPYRKW
jgi:general secretion pathway protein G